MIYLKGIISDKITNKLDDLGFAWVVEEDLDEITQIEDGDVSKTIQTLTDIRKKAVLEKDENYKFLLYYEY